jgi:hypothetical protein
MKVLRDSNNFLSYFYKDGVRLFEISYDAYYGYAWYESQYSEQIYKIRMTMSYSGHGYHVELK